MSGYESLGYWSQETSHSSSHQRNNDDIPNNESLEVSAGDGRCIHRSLHTIQYFSTNRGVYHSSDDVRGGSGYQ